MDYTYVKDESGKITDILVNGKPVKRGSMRGMRKAQKCSYFILREQPVDIGTDVLNGLEATIFSFIKNWERRYNQALNQGVYPIEKLTGAPVETFDDMRYFFREINPGLYMDILD